MPHPGDGDTLDIGPRLRAIRRARGYTLRGLAKRTGFSASFLSQAELGQVSPSLGSLDRIAVSLGTSLAALLSRAPDSPGPIVQRSGAPGLRSEWSRATAQSLLPAGNHEGVALVLIMLEPGGRTGKHPRSAAGQELAFCVRGSITVEVGSEQFHLAKSDSLFYDASRGIVCRNDGARPAEMLLLTLRPARRKRTTRAQRRRRQG